MVDNSNVVHRADRGLGTRNSGPSLIHEPQFDEVRRWVPLCPIPRPQRSEMLGFSLPLTRLHANPPSVAFTRRTSRACAMPVDDSRRSLRYRGRAASARSREAGTTRARASSPPPAGFEGLIAEARTITEKSGPDQPTVRFEAVGAFKPRDSGSLAHSGRYDRRHQNKPTALMGKGWGWGLTPRAWTQRPRR